MNLEYAMKGETLVHVSSVERGLMCGCTCPGCGASLIARKGQIKAHHFAHKNAECEYGTETMLHIMAKSILEQEKKILLPKVEIRFELFAASITSEPRLVPITDVTLEKRLGDFVPDLLVQISGKFVIIEILVTHKVDDLKLNKIKDSQISAIEIDLSKFDRSITLEELRDILINRVDNKSWIFNGVSEYYMRKWLALCEYKKTVYRGYALHVDMCPIRARIYKGKPYANVMDDCSSCEFCLGLIQQNPDKDTKTLLCCGATKIKTYDDLRKYLREHDA